MIVKGFHFPDTRRKRTGCGKFATESELYAQFAHLLLHKFGFCTKASPSSEVAVWRCCIE